MDTDKYHVDAWIKSGASLSEISNSVFNSSKDFDSRKFLIVYYYIYTNLKDLKNIFCVGKYTNLILCVKYDQDDGFKNMMRHLGILKCQYFSTNISFKLILNRRINGRYNLNKNNLCIYN